MNSEAKTIIAFLFKRSGKTKLSFSEMYLTLSMDLDWFIPNDAKEFVTQSIKEKFLVKKDNLISPGFDIDKITIPVGFTPTKNVFEKKVEKKATEYSEDIFEQIVEKITKKTKISDNEIIKKIKELEKEKNITQEVAAILIGKEYNVSLEEFYEGVENKIF